MDFQQSETQARDTAETVARRSYGKLVAFLAAQTRNVPAAEDALSEAFGSALVEWPQNGCPSNPEAWLLTVARRRTIDGLRRKLTADKFEWEVQRGIEARDGAGGAEIPDRRLALMFVCAHPAIDAAIRAPLMLQVVLGLDAKTIGSAFLVSPSTMGKRLVRAKEKIRQTSIPFSVPEREQLPERLDAVLNAIYAAFTQGWTDPGGADFARRDLTEEALFLGRLVAELLPDEPEALGLLALMLYADARRTARRDGQGDYVPLAQQDPALWNETLIGEAEALLLRARALRSTRRYQLEAALQSAHIHRCRTGYNNWPDVLALYESLLALTSSPVVAINRALAVAEIDGPAVALQELSELAADVRLVEYQPYWAARAEILARAGANKEAHNAYEIAIGLEPDPAIRRFLLRRQAALL